MKITTTKKNLDQTSTSYESLVKLIRTSKYGRERNVEIAEDFRDAAARGPKHGEVAWILLNTAEHHI